MKKEEWDELPIGTVSICSLSNTDYIEVKRSQKTTLIVGVIPEDDAHIIRAGEIDNPELDYTEVAPKWIQDCFEVI